MAAIVLVACVVAVTSADGLDPDSDFVRAGGLILPPVRPGKDATVITVSTSPVGRPIAPGFVGLSMEYNGLEPYAGRDPSAIDPVLIQLIRNLSPGQRPVLRIGGDSTDWAWWPVPHMRKPAGIRIVLGPRFGAVLASVSRALNARLILGIDLEAGSRRLAGFEAAQLIRAVGRDAVQALELGNEPELYGSWPWFVAPGGRRVAARGPGYDMSTYIGDFGRTAAKLPDAGLAGPALGGPRWIRQVGQFIAREPRLTAVTIHTYPLQRCYTPLISPTYPTIKHMLAASSTLGLAARIAPAVRLVHARRLPLRVDEINSVSCGGAPGVSDTFASALWALETMFALARTGVDGVNIHTFENAAYRLFRTARRHGRWRAVVAPEYYGLLLFAQAAPPGSRLLRLSGDGAALRAWATRSANGTVHIVLINNSPAPHVVVVHDRMPPAPASYEALRAPSLSSRHGVSLGDASFGASTETGILRAPRAILMRPTHGRYVLRLAGASAAMLTINPRQTSRLP